MSGIMNMLVAAKTAIAAAIDSYFNLTTLLLSGNGTNGAQNNTFLDSSSNNFTITRNGNTTQGTFSPFSQTGWSNYLDGTGDSISCSTNAIAATGQFSFEAWVYQVSRSTTVDQHIFSQYTGGAGGRFYIRFNNTVLAFTSGLGSVNGATTLNTDTWYHVVVTRDSSDKIRIFVNGVLDGSATISGSLDTTASIVGASGTANYWFGYVSNVRVVSGSIPTAYQTSSTTNGTSVFTPPTAPLTAISGTSLLTCQSNRFVDNSASPMTLTINGNSSVQAFSPFAPTAAYSAATNGGSGYFDGTGDYLTAADNTAFEFGSGAFTIEAWVYVTATPGASGASVITKSSATYPGGYEFNFVVQNDRKAFCGFYTTTQLDLTGTTALPLNAWAHLAVSRSGNNFALFVNGAREATSSAGGTIQATSSSLYIGDYGGGSRNLTGYISGARLVKGTAVYDPTVTTLTIPTAPPTDITNTSLLLNFTNAGITDATAKNDLETVGNAQISTTQSKFGGSSMYFDGTGDYLVTPSSVINALGSGDFTIEMWVNPSATTNNYPCIISNLAFASNSWQLYDRHLSANTKFTFWVYNINTSSPVLTSTTTVSNGTWYHLAITRSGSTWRLFVNGTQEASTTSTAAADAGTSYSLSVGWSKSSTENYAGYIDDLRITRGYARYTANFTAPTAAFALQ
jgi:hypothetical protein